LSKITTLVKNKNFGKKIKFCVQNHFLSEGPILALWVTMHVSLPNEVTHEINPAKNALNGNVPTKQQYTN